MGSHAAPSDVCGGAAGLGQAGEGLTANAQYSFSALVEGIVLRALADALRAVVRDGVDHVGRLGGEEFAVLLPNLDAAAAASADRLRAAVAQVSVPVPGLNGMPIEITFRASFDVAELAPGTDDFEALLRAADQALYAAKTAGRDRVYTQPSDLPVG